MEVQVSGFENNRPVLTTYRIVDEALAVAVSSSKVGRFSVATELDTDKQYALIDEKGEFFGMIMCWDDVKSPMLTTIPKFYWKTNVEFRVHDIEELDKQLNY